MMSDDGYRIRVPYSGADSARLLVDLLALDSLDRPWIVSMLRQVSGQGGQVDHRLDWSSVGTGLVRCSSVARSHGYDLARTSVSRLSIEDVVAQVVNRIGRGESGWRLLRFGWSATALADALAAKCFHPATVEQFAHIVERDGLVRLDPSEIVEGDVETIAPRLRFRRCSLWVPARGMGSLYAIGTNQHDGSERLVIAKLDPSRVRLLPPEVADAAHEGSSRSHR